MNYIVVIFPYWRTGFLLDSSLIAKKRLGKPKENGLVILLTGVHIALHVIEDRGPWAKGTGLSRFNLKEKF